MKKLLYPLTGLTAALAVILFRVRHDSLWTSWLYHAKTGGRFFQPGLLLTAVTGHRLVSALALAGGILLCGLLLLFLDSPLSDRLFVRKLFPAMRIGHVFTLSLLLLLVMAVMIGAGMAGKADEVRELTSLQARIRESGEIIHAGGQVSDSEGNAYSYTNSLESVMNCVRQGNPFVELDFQLTTDGYPVCVHGWNALLDEDGSFSEEALSLDEFRSRKIMGIFTPMTLDDLAAVMEENPGMYIIADIRGKLAPCLKSILTACPGLRDRFIIQIYHEKQYETVYAMGFHQIIYTLYRTSEEEHSLERLRRFSGRSILLGLTMRTAIFYQEDLHTGLLGLDLPLFVHTIDNEEEKKQLHQDGAAAIYTNISTRADRAA
ncbi:MAG: hypothetical protein J6S83_15480 [Lachnospiraceae bacterium]|nr:hypothetical protein [Lachnospiraceae bacterium]